MGRFARPRISPPRSAGPAAVVAPGPLSQPPSLTVAEAESLLLTGYRGMKERETTIPRWRELQGMFRRLEARGNVRGGRFLSGFGGEQFAVPEAVASLRETRLNTVEEAITVAAILLPHSPKADINGFWCIGFPGQGCCASRDREFGDYPRVCAKGEGVNFCAAHAP